MLYVKGMDANLLSSGKIAEKNVIVEHGKVAKIFNMKKELIAIAHKRENNLYYLESYKDCETSGNVNSVPEAKVNVTSTNSMSLKEKWHRMLGHISFSKLKFLCENELLDGAPKRLESENFKCAICLEFKMNNVPFKDDREKATEILQIVHTDVNGPHCVGYCGEQYFVTFIDDYSKLVKVYCIKSKSDVYNCLVEYVNLVENLTGKRIKELRCDNGTEYINKRVDEFVKNRGIYLRPCVPYVHELNGTAERYNRTLMDRARCLLAEAKVARKFWPECIATAAYLTNRSLGNTVEKKTPFEIFFNKKPDVTNLRMYGCRVFTRVPDARRNSKWDRKADCGILLGYTDLGYRVLVNNRIRVTRHVNFVDDSVKCISLRDDEVDDVGDSVEPKVGSGSVVAPQVDEGLDICLREEAGSSEKQVEGQESDSTELRRSTREKKMSARLADSVVYVNVCSADAPESYQEAVSRFDSNLWQQAMSKEIQNLEKNGTWEEVSLPQGKKALDAKWVYRVKPDGTHKAHLVVRGFQQDEELDDIYSPVARMCTLKLLLSLCCHKGFQIHQMDVEAAFLNGPIVSEVYIKQPLGYSNVENSNNVLCLKKSLYGLKESPRNWYECFNDFISTLDFERNRFDYCLYSTKDNVNQIFIILFVDDLLICGKNSNAIADIKRKLSEHFEMKDLGKVSSYLGIEINFDVGKRIMTLSQERYIESLAIKYNVTNSKLFDTPMEMNLKLEKAEMPDPNVKFRNLIGALLYVIAGTRPDITFSVNYLSRFQSAYSCTHYNYALRILKYLCRTRNLKLTYRFSSSCKLDVYVDSDWAGDVVDRRSTTGFVIRLFGNPILWKAQKQGNVTKSSTYAEYVALSEAVTEVTYLVGVCEQLLPLELIRPVCIFEDNLGTVCIANLGNFTKKSKHIEVHYHFVHEAVQSGLISVVKVNSSDNLADIFTKTLSKSVFVNFRNLLNLC